MSPASYKRERTRLLPAAILRCMCMSEACVGERRDGVGGRWHERSFLSVSLTKSNARFSSMSAFSCTVPMLSPPLPPIAINVSAPMWTPVEAAVIPEPNGK